MPLRVGLNLLHLVPGETGGSEIYARRLIPALLEACAGLELVVFSGREAEPVLRTEAWGDEVEIVPLPVEARSRTRRVLAEQTLLPAAARRARVRLLHNLFTTAPLLPGVPQVTTILDVIYKRFPATHAGAMRHGMAVLVPLAARQSRRVITISEAAKQDIVRFLGAPADRVDVTYLGPGMGDDIQPLPEAEVRAQLALTDAPIVLTVSAKRPHKNLERLFEAFTRVETAQPPLLVVPGYETPFEDELRRYAGCLNTDRIRFTGWLDDAMLAGLYAASLVFVFPSLAEGFGLPVLEAMRRGVPVACSDATSLPEVAGDAALYFDPSDVASITEAMEKLLLDSRLRERLRTAGKEQARRFSWKATAEATLMSYARALEPPPAR
jgi:glycosyltransferase involved in cell wall biosynthesis